MNDDFMNKTVYSDLMQNSYTINPVDMDSPTLFATWPPKYKYAEDEIIKDFKAYIDKTYKEHYKTDEESVECFDAWIALGDSMPTFRNTALKYLWRYGKKKGSNKDDLMKTLHYVLMCLYVDHYKKGE